ncbi:MAG TPA: hypothetical protein DD734_12420 [Firmicutes bacterium]|nr:hypothetical protein [Bacillota bacterium]
MILLPHPRQLSQGESYFMLNGHTAIVLWGAASRQELVTAKQLQDDIKLYAGLGLSIRRGKPAQGDIVLTYGDGITAQGYKLRISPDGVEIRGGDRQGAVYGVQTLRQIISENGAVLPAVEIEDWPTFRYRGFYHDVTRGRVPTLDSLKKLVDTMGAYKLNQLQLYVEHTYLFRNFSEVWRGDTPLTAEDILELDGYCDDRGIELIPSLACFGHMFEVLRTKSFGELCELEDGEMMSSTYSNRMEHHTINVTDERALPFVFGMLEEYMPLFRSEHFNICADETFDLGKGKSGKRAQEVGVDRLYIDFLKELCGFLLERGKKPMFWGDIIARRPEMVKELPAGVICLNWGYDPRQTDKSIRQLAAAGAVQYVCPGVCGWNRWLNQLRSSYDNITRMCRYGRENGAIGVLTTDWGDYGHINHPPFSLPGLIYGAAFSWSEGEIGFEQINEEIARLLYHDRTGRVVGLLGKLSEAVIYPWEVIVRFRELVLLGDEVGAREIWRSARSTVSVSVQHAALDRTLQELYQCIRQMDTRQRGMLQAWSIATEAIQLWNRVGAYVSAFVANQRETREEGALATELENWYLLYGRLWRGVSQQSDLSRIGDIVSWYADLLRTAQLPGPGLTKVNERAKEGY